jgi:hypothetical protein
MKNTPPLSKKPTALPRFVGSLTHIGNPLPKKPPRDPEGKKGSLNMTGDIKYLVRGQSPLRGVAITPSHEGDPGRLFTPTLSVRLLAQLTSVSPPKQ